MCPLCPRDPSGMDLYIIFGVPCASCLVCPVHHVWCALYIMFGVPCGRACLHYVPVFLLAWRVTRCTLSTFERALPAENGAVKL